jgi:monovalent cation:proton antiporter-2 (CPA2) family protein
MQLSDFLLGAFTYLAAAVLSAPIAARLGLGSVLGYLIAGILIGPAVLGIVGSEGADIMHFAEFGVIVMLFIIGLELQPSRLWELRKSIFGLGSLQVVLTAATIALAAAAFDWTWGAAAAAGVSLAMSSTALVLQNLKERGLLRTGAGQSAFSVLLFQDVAVIPIFALLPLMAMGTIGETESHGRLASLPAWAQALAVLGAVSFIIAAGRYLMRPVFRLIAETRLRELFTATALLIVVAIALLMGLVGLSPALGSFLGGVVLAENEYRHELEMDLDPFKGLLLAVFFISVGAGIDFNLVAGQPGTITGLVLGFMAIKFALLYGLARLFRLNAPDGLLFAFALAQGGEFAFVLLAYSSSLQLLTIDQANLMIAAVAISMALSPLLFIFHDRVLAPRFERLGEARSPDVIDEKDSPVIIAGFGRFGMTVSRLLQAQGFKTTVLDHDASQVDLLRQFGFKVFYGDASRPDLLEAAGARDAKILVVAVDEQEKILEIVETAKRHFPHLGLFVRAWDRVHAYELINAGVIHVYREVFGSSVELAEDALAELGVHRYTASRAARNFRHYDQQLLHRVAPLAGDTAALIDATRAARDEVSRILASDRTGHVHFDDQAWQAPDKRPDVET